MLSNHVILVILILIKCDLISAIIIKNAWWKMHVHIFHALMQQAMLYNLALLWETHNTLHALNGSKVTKKIRLASYHQMILILCDHYELDQVYIMHIHINWIAHEERDLKFVSLPTNSMQKAL